MDKIRRKMNKKGFTLIELIVVIAILAVIAAIAVPIFGGLLDNSKQTAADADAKTIATQAQLYLTQEELAGTDLRLTSAALTSTQVADIYAKCTGLQCAATDVTINVAGQSSPDCYQLASVSVEIDGKTGTFPKASSTTSA